MFQASFSPELSTGYDPESRVGSRRLEILAERAGSGQEVFEISRWRVWSIQEVAKSNGWGRITLARPDPREVTSPGKKLMFNHPPDDIVKTNQH